MKDFSKYLKDGRRVAAFGQQYDNEIEVFLLYCSKKDHFSKKLARNIYSMWFAEEKQERVLIRSTSKIIEQAIELLDSDNNPYTKTIEKAIIIPYYAHPIVLRIPIKKGDTALHTFNVYMNETFYRKKYTVIPMIKIKEYLYKHEEEFYLKGSSKYRIQKLSEDIK